MDLHGRSGEAEAAGLRMDLQPQAAPSHDVVVADNALVSEAADAIEIFRSGAPCLLCLAGRASEAAVVVGEEAAQDEVGGRQIRSVGQTKFAGQAILQHAPEALDAAFGLRALCGDEGDAELFQSAAKLSSRK